MQFFQLKEKLKLNLGVYRVESFDNDLKYYCAELYYIV